MSAEAEECVQVFVRIRPEFHDGTDGGPHSVSKGRRDSFGRLTPTRSSFAGFGSPSPVGNGNGSSSSSRVRASVSDVSLSPMNGEHNNACCTYQVDDQTVGIVHPEHNERQRKSVAALDEKVFTFDRVFADTSTQEEIYQLVSAHVKACVRGYNTTIFAYGSTGSGKSFTMTGEREAPGVIPRAITEIFSMISATTAQKENDVFFYVRLSYVELYNNNFRNLLEFASKELAAKGRHDDPNASSFSSSSSSAAARKVDEVSPKSDKIEVRESPSAGVFLAGHNLRIPVTSAEEAMQLISKGNKQRVVSATQCNDVSSRSHAILTLHVESENLAAGANPGDKAVVSELRLGKMHLVDLAGSERLTLSGAEGDTLVETQNINLSLTALGDVLSALSRNSQVSSPTQKGSRRSLLTAVPVPYRNSKLTHLLKDSLGGNSKTIMIANIRTAMMYYQQTAVTLMYASRAKKIKNKVTVNKNAIGDTGIHTVTQEIERLRARLDERSNEFEMLRHSHLRDAHENEALKRRLQKLKEANEREKKQLENQMSNIIHSQAGQLAKQNEKISTLQQSLQDELTVSQNRIAEQEQEIKWLKKALDDAAKQPPTEQLQHLQKVIDGVQAQADELRTQNVALNHNLSATVAGAAQIRKQLEIKASEANDRQGAIARLEARIAQLEKEVADEREQVKALQAKDTDAAALKTQLEKVEKDKGKLQQKLEQTITLFEQRTSTTIAKVTTTLEESDRRYREADAKAKQFEKDLTASKAAHAAEKQQLEAAVEGLRADQRRHDARMKTAEEGLAAAERERAKEKEQLAALRGDHQRGVVDLKAQFDGKVNALRAAHEAETAKRSEEHAAALRRALTQQKLESATEMEAALEKMQAEVIKSQKKMLEGAKASEEKAMQECIVLAEGKFNEAQRAAQARHAKVRASGPACRGVMS